MPVEKEEEEEQGTGEIQSCRAHLERSQWLVGKSRVRGLLQGDESMPPCIRYHCRRLGSDDVKYGECY
jgi:hypothetical protein